MLMCSKRLNFNLFLGFLFSLSLAAGNLEDADVSGVIDDNSLSTDSPFQYITLENILRLSNISEDVWSNNYLDIAWKGWSYDKSISVRGCLEQGWLDPTKQAFVNVEKCGDWVFLDTFIALNGPKNLDNELNRAFTKLGTELLKYKIGMEEDHIIYRVIKGPKTYQIKVNWQMKYLFVSVVK